MQIFRYSIEGDGIKDFIDLLKREFMTSYSYMNQGKDTIILVSERYSFLQNSDMAAVIVVDILNDRACNLELIVAGGRTGIFRLDIYGREKATLKSIKELVEKLCNEKGLRIISFGP